MEYLNFDVAIHPKSNDLYPVAARSHTGEASHTMRFPFEGLALENVLLQVQNALLRAGNVHRGTGTPEEHIVQSFGQALFEALLMGDVRRLYDASVAQATQQRKGLRVRLQIAAPELASLPWEFLYDPLQHEYLCFLPEIALVRYLETVQPIPPFKVAPPLRVLAMIADPSDQDRLNVAHERQRLIAALGPLEQLGLVKLRWVEGQTVRDLHQALLQRYWHIFHFIGHGAFDPGSQEGVLALVNEQGRTHRLSATDLGRLLALSQSLRLVVLNSCQGAAGNRHNLFSSTAATLASKRIPAVLAMQYDITDQAAVEFTRGFYGALAVGIPVDGAMTQARTAISVGTPRTLEWVTPVLYLRSPTGALFDVPSPMSQIFRANPPGGISPSLLSRSSIQGGGSSSSYTGSSLRNQLPGNPLPVQPAPAVPQPTHVSPSLKQPRILYALLLALMAMVMIGGSLGVLSAFGSKQVTPTPPVVRAPTPTTAPATFTPIITVTPTPQGCQKAFSDNFNTSLNPGWSWVDPVGDAGQTLSDRAGWLKITTPPNRDLYAPVNFKAPRLLQPIDGDFTITVFVDFTSTTPPGYQGAGILIWEGQQNFLELLVARRAGADRIEFGAPLDNRNFGAVSRTDNPVELQIQRRADSFIAYWQGKDGLWKKVGQGSVVFAHPLVGLTVLNPSDVETFAYFDEFTVSCN